MPNLTINGQSQRLAEPVTIQDVLEHLGVDHTHVAVAVNGAILPPAQWHQPLENDSIIEVLTPFQGG